MTDTIKISSRESNDYNNTDYNYTDYNYTDYNYTDYDYTASSSVLMTCALILFGLLTL